MKKQLTSWRVGQMLWSFLRFVIIFGLAFIILKPMIFKFFAAFMSSDDLINPAVSQIPLQWSVQFWKSAIEQMKLPESLFNTFGLSFIVGVLQVAVSTMAGYGLGRFKFKGRGILFAVIILLMLIPASVTSTAQYVRFAFFGIGNIKINIVNHRSKIYRQAYTCKCHQYRDKRSYVFTSCIYRQGIYD